MMSALQFFAERDSNIVLHIFFFRGEELEVQSRMSQLKGH